MLSEHLNYVGDRQRNTLFREAVKRTVRAGDHVLDMGCGAGILGLFCLQAGAARVTAVDLTDIVDIASETFSRVGYADRVDVIQSMSRWIDVADPVDLIICDNVGCFGLDYFGIIDALRDAQQRFLRPGGRIVPEGVRLHLAPVGSASCARCAFGWAGTGVPEELHWISAHTVNTKYNLMLKPEDYLATPAQLGSVDFRTEDRPFLSWTAEMVATRPGEMHGLGGWFDCTLCEGVTMTNSPFASDRIDRGQAFFPIEEPLQVGRGDVIRASLALRHDERSFAWTVEHVPSGRRFRHATMKGDFFRKEDFVRAQGDHVPQPTAQARAGQIVLGYCDGQRTVREIEAAVLSDHPDLFPTPEAAAQFVALWLGKHTT